MTLQELKEQAIALSADERMELISAIAKSLKPAAAGKQQWQHLAPRTESWRQQLYIKGRKLRASSVVSDMVVNKMSPAEAAEDWDLPLAAIHEAVEYCASHQELIAMEAAEERRSLDEEPALEPTPIH